VEAEVSTHFDILRKLELPGPGLWFAGRERSSGIMRWLLCGADSDTAGQIDALARRLNGVMHPNLVELAGTLGSGAGLTAIFHWNGEEPLSDAALSAMPAPDRLRCASQLLEVLYHLQQNARPLAHGGLGVGSLWLTPSLRWCRLGAYNPAVGQGSEAALQEDRRAALGLLSRLFLGDAVYSSELQELEDLGARWIEEHYQNWDGMKRLVQRAYLESVAVNL